MAGSTRKGGNSKSDFKRIKAKVGKRALKTNDTDVSFQSASLYIAGQSIQNASKTVDASSVLSSRGKSLLELSAQLNHPATAMRASALKGMQDIAKKQSPDSLLPHLSILLPACVHSCVDEDGDVRSLGLDVLTTLLSKQQERSIQPFGTLLAARISSALNSLDPPTRIDGVRMARMISSTCPTLTRRFATRLLPPFVALLADSRTRDSIDEVLQALILLLRVQRNDTNTRRTQASACFPTNDKLRSQDHIYGPGGRSRNSIVLADRLYHELPLPVASITRLPTVDRQSRLKLVNTPPPTAGSNIMTILLSRLRDVLVESTNQELEVPGGPPTGAPNNTVDGVNLSRTILILRAIRLIHLCNSTEEGDGDTQDEEFEKLSRKIVTLLMELFPMAQNFNGAGEANSSNPEDEANVAIATTVLDVVFIPSFFKASHGSCFSAHKEKSREWMQTICFHVVPRTALLAKDPNSESSPDVDITCKLLRCLSKDRHGALAFDQILRMLKEGFLDGGDAALARSNAGRRVAVIVIELLKENNLSLADISNSPTSVTLTKFVVMMPFFLQAWAVDFMYESQMVLNVLHSLVRQEDNNSDDPILASLRENCDKLVCRRGSFSPRLSVFEMYPYSLKKTFMGFLVMLRKPSASTLKALSAICGRSMTIENDTLGVTVATVDLILESVFCVRQSLPMQAYLTFLISSIGMSSHGKQVVIATSDSAQQTGASENNVLESVLFSLDPILNRVGRVLVRSGSPTRVLEMLLPQLSIWQRSVAVGESSMVYIVRMRASLVVLVFFSSTVRETDKCSSIFKNAEALPLQNVTEAMCRFLRIVISNDSLMMLQSRLLSPMVALMRYDPEILESVFQAAGGWLVEAGLQNSEQCNLLGLFAYWLGDSALDSILLNDTVDRLSEIVKRISQTATMQENEQARSLAGQVSARLQVRKSFPR